MSQHPPTDGSGSGFGQDSGYGVSEQLYSSDGTPIAAETERPRRARKGLLVGGGVALAVLVGGGAWALSAFFSQGAQPAEALPAGTLGYVAIDLDPTGQQKLEAVEMLGKFPAFEDKIGLDTDDDVKQKLFEAMQRDGICPDLNYGSDVEPWLGNRAGIAAVDLGEDEVIPVAVVQVKDGDGAVAGIEKLVECSAEGEAQGEESAGGDEIGGYAVSGDWVVLAETEALAQGVVDATAEANLADDEEYQRWMASAGDPGVMSMYAAPAAGQAVLDFSTGFDDLSSSGGEPDPQTREMLEKFPGAAGVVRFDDGALEMEVVTGELESDLAQAFGTDRGDDALATLPQSTAVAVGIGFADGWVGTLIDYLGPMIEEDAGMSLDEALAEAERETGLALPEDLETLLGTSFSFALDGAFDPEQFFAGGVEEFPLGAKIAGDPEAMDAVLEKLRARFGADADLLASRVDGDHLLVGPSPAYLDRLAADGGLGDTVAFRSVVPNAEEAASIFYLNFDAGNWLVRLAEFDQNGETKENLAPLQAFGISSWIEDGEAHSLVRLTTED
ncbi:DUF3352 domain-containing protein [Nocardioides donggukensis]|uniref:DUF3352 domain-containing protein n=1 Tax=Nocardioides donggukensis TaxID=2774019 RepID=A0A927Q187_9ACTN|nr:DUF3352 domain-containing protein [Nocardioides donggukensis]MBD8869234.1 DUF3352 domain-containing protein [Nocardioides donggukensis]